MTGDWRKLQNEEMIRSRRMRWAGHVARMEKLWMNIGYWREGEKATDHWESFCEHGNEPSTSKNADKFLSSCTTSGFLRRAQVHEIS
jgi:hypothetical protein